MRALGAALALLLTVGAAEAEPRPGPIVPDRPDFANSTATVGSRVVQVEGGAAYGLTSATGGAQRQLFGEGTLRGGLTGRLEARLGGQPFVRQRGPDDATGSGDYFVGLKWRFYEPPEGSGLPSLGVQPAVKLPTAAEPIGTGLFDFGAAALASFDLPWGLSLDVNAGLAAVGQSRPSGYLLQALAAVTLGADVGERWLPFASLFYASPDRRDGGDVLSMQAGLGRRATPDVALDLSAQTSLIGQAPDWLVRAGFAVRFGR
jgi:hypothetical protein